MAFAARLSAALAGIETSKLICVLWSLRLSATCGAVSTILTAQPGGLPAHTLASTAERCA